VLSDWLRATGQPRSCCFLNCRASRATLETKGVRNAGKLLPVSALFVFGIQQFRFRDGGKKLSTIM
jgi:hypothetical protein